MQVDDPPCLSVGTAVSAKYKGAFCEAKVSNAVHIVKCKVSFKMGLGTYTVNDDHVKGTLRVGQLVQARHPEKREYLEATIMKIQDCSQYTVVFDDGDITTLRRSALCLKSGRHFNESETLDQLPLTHPEHFGNPVVGGRRGRRNRQAKEDSSEEEQEDDEYEYDLISYKADIGRVFCIETTDKKRTKDNWFPGLVVIPSAQPTVRINIKDEYLVRSFKDGRYYTVPKKEVASFTRQMAERIENSSLSEACLKYFDNGDLPVHWDRTTLFNLQSVVSDSEENYTDSCDEEQSEEKDLFVAQLYKFMEDARTPLNTSPTIAKRDVDLHRLYRIVEKLGGYNRVTNQSKWKTVTIRMRLPNNQNTWSQVQNVYKTYLSSFESFYRTLGVTMTVKTRSNKKNRGRSLIRDKDRATPVNSPRPDKEDEVPEKKEEEKPKKKAEVKKDEDKKKNIVDTSDTNSNDANEQSDAPSTVSDTGRPKRNDSKSSKERKLKTPVVEKVKSQPEPVEEPPKKIEEKTQQTRSKTQGPKVLVKDIAKDQVKEKETKEPPVVEKKKEAKPAPVEAPKVTPSAKAKKPVVVIEEDKKRCRKRPMSDDKPSSSDNVADIPASIPVSIGDRLIVYYGPNIESKITYEAKVIDIKDSSYLVHYTGWNTRYDEWIMPENIAVNLSAKGKHSKAVHNAASPSSKGTPPKVAGRRGRGQSITGKSSTSEHPRSTTPSSVTSSSSRTKSPATPATRSNSRITRQDSTRRTRRCSAQTEASVQSDSDSEASESELETMRTRSGSKTDQESDVKTFRRKNIKSFVLKAEKRKMEEVDSEPDKKRKGRSKKSEEDEDMEKEEEIERPKRTRHMKKSEDEDTEKEEELETSKDVDVKIEKKSDDEDTEKEEEMHEPLKRLRKVVKKSEDEDTEKEEETESKLDVKIEKSEDDDTEKESDTERVKCIKKVKKSPEKIVLDSDEDSTNLPKGRDFDLNLIRLELKGLKVPPIDSLDKDVTSSDDSVNLPMPEKSLDEDAEGEEEEVEVKTEEPCIPVASEDIYEFKEPEPFEFETRKLVEDKNNKKRIPRLLEELEKSPKKRLIKSPGRVEEKESPPASDKKRPRRTLKRLAEDSDDEYQKKLDAFDKLVESPSYNMGKTVGVSQEPQLSPQQPQLTPQQLVLQQQKAVDKILEEPLFSEQIDVYQTERLDLSDTDNEPLFTRGDELFSDPFSKSSPNRNLELDFCKVDEPKNKESDEEELLRESINRVIAQTSTDEDSNDALRITPPVISYQAKKKDTAELLSSQDLLSMTTVKVEEVNVETSSIVKKDSAEIVENIAVSPVKHISPALQETDSSLLESIVAQPPLLTTTTEVKEQVSLKPGPKIADTILQKLSLLKNSADTKSSKQSSNSDGDSTTTIVETKLEVKPDLIKEEVKLKTFTSKVVEVKKSLLDTEDKNNEANTTSGRLSPKKPQTFMKSVAQTAKSPIQSPITVSAAFKNIKQSTPVVNTTMISKHSTITSTIKTLKTLTPTSYSQDIKKRRKVLSRPYIDESDSDSSDSEQLVIARSDEDSQMNVLLMKPENKDSLSNMSLVPETTTDESQCQEETRNFKFDDIVKEETTETPKEESTAEAVEEANKEEEHDPHLHNLLLCEETIPRSPAPATECVIEAKIKVKSVLEMPFASAPGSSNNKNILLDSSSEKSVGKQEGPQMMMLEERQRENCNSSSAVDNTPPASPATPESTICMSPRGQNGGISPSGGDVDSCKSNEAAPEYSRQRRNSTKISPYSEEDTQMTEDGSRSPGKKQRDDEMSDICRKRRKSSKCEDTPIKRGRKPLNRSRHNSDSDDTSEDHSLMGTSNVRALPYRRSLQPPRPTKYNFYVEFDASVDRTERIAVIMQKLSEIRKTYADVKSELAAVERRRKKLRRREREAMKTAKQELVCA